VGDRGMLTQTRIDALKQHPQLGWISALRSHSIAELVEQGELQLSLFDEQNLAEIQSAVYPGERLVVCYNPLLAQDRKRTRNELLEASEKELARIVAYVAQRTKTPLKADEIGLKVGKAIQRFKMAKHFTFDIEDGRLSFRRDEEHIRREEQLDGIYVIRTSESQANLSAQDTVRTYKSLGQVEQAFRCLKSLDLRIRPIHHRTAQHVKAHIFLCMLAYYVEWHMRKALAPVLFHDDELDDDRWTRDPVAKAHPSPSAQHKKATRTTNDGWPIHSFQTLLDELATRCKNTCRAGHDANATRFNQTTELTPFQRHVHVLLKLES
jgi:transposase